MNTLQYIDFDHFELCSGRQINLRLSYQVFGKSIYDNPVVLVNHALTGNSEVTGENGWWNTIVGENKVIDTNEYTVLAFNCPGNGFKELGETFSEYYKEFTARDIARLFSEGLNRLNIQHLHAVIGASVGGGITWELAALRPSLADYIVPIAADWKSTDWVIGNCFIQDKILNHSSNPVSDARLHAMTFYRTPESFSAKFNRTKTSRNQFNVESWLKHHGEKLNGRFKLSAYKMMNQILKTIDITHGEISFVNATKHITSHIHIITINSDLLFTSVENWNTFVELKTIKENVTIGEIKSNDGHDAFLIESQQLTKLLHPVFNLNNKTNENYKSSYIRNW
ncbi:alpha/beta fold hydrolase [Winogradskyella sp. UBA3174]|uniref:alpha/beta fold hydrolase n=1 Tax=Winogradskyella sp. UBA3174 TaxID=1947785 RepID=UPI0025DD829C|nr:alpha/beta fold hydrolase [Winogradskyella sp. UBA3174]|tara:strand:+ start:36932 stop:37948 length:1017 start_codon:yes stop_codon:yes gene_type:complete